MKTKFTRQEKLLNLLILHSADCPSCVGLLTGQMGIVLTIARYARIKGMAELETIADTLLENVLARAASLRNIGFASGLSGICWGIEYLIQHGILPGSGDEICKKVDNHIMKNKISNMDDLSLETGTLGLWYYVWARIQGNLREMQPLPFSKEYLSDWFDFLTVHHDKFPAGASDRLYSAMNGHLIEEELNINQFIKRSRKLNENDLSLSTGVAGYIETHYLY